jgi:hypothetical protein
MRRNPMDPRRRRAQRRSVGDPQAAGEFLWEVARSGRWFLPGDWENPDGSRYPYPSTVNTLRAAWVRLLGYLRWPMAADLEGAIVSTISPRLPAGLDPLEFPYLAWRPQDDLGKVKPFSRIGPETAKAIGGEVMKVLALAATGAVAHLEPSMEEKFPEASRLQAYLDELNAEYDLHRALGTGREWQRSAQELSEKTQALGVVLDDLIGRSLRGYGPNAASYSRHHALEAFWVAFSPRHYSDMPAAYSRAVFHSIMAEGFACDAEKGASIQLLDDGSCRRPRNDEGDRYGASPTRGCTIKANKRIRAVMLGPTLIKVAQEITRWG